VVRSPFRTVTLCVVVASATGLQQCPACRRPAAPPVLSRRASAPRLSLQTEEETKRAFSLPQLNGRVASTRKKDADPPTGGGLAAAGGVLASSAVIAEGVQIAGTAVLFYLGQQWTGTSSPVEAVSYMIDFLQQAGLAGYGYFAAAMITLQVFPVAAAFVLTVSAGAIFGAVKGTATVLTCSTISATISFLLSRTFGRERLMDAAQESKQYRAIDAAFAEASFGTSLTLITLLRLSPVLPFAWANYVFGLSPVPLPAFSIGTFVGCLPAVAGYVSAGQVGAEIAVSGADSNPLVLALGVAATLGAITFAGNIATNALKDLDVDLSEE